MFDGFEEEDEFYDAEEGGAQAAAHAAHALLPPRENPDLLGHAANERAILDFYNQGKLPHAMIFAGPQGIGKATMAFRVARFLLKHGAGGADQDNLFGDAPAAPSSLYVAPDDPVFRKVASGGHPDMRFFERPLDEKRGVRKGSVDIDSVRKIAPFLRMSSSEGGWRVVIVDEADTMKREAQNAILKILEEPPPRALLMLVCNRPGAMIPTIRSRCRTVHFAPLNDADMTSLIARAAPDATTGEKNLLNALSDGSIGRAVTLHQEEGAKTLNTLLSLFEDAPAWDWIAIHHLGDNLSKNGMEQAYGNFAMIFEWAAQAFLRGKAAGARAVPEILRTERLEPLANHYSLEQWIEICEKLKDHFTSIETGNLDKRHGVMGAFAIMGGQK